MKELKIFLTSLMFFSKIPVFKKFEVTEELQNKSIRYFPLVGLILGGLGAFSFFLLSEVLPFNLCILLAMAFMIFLSGAFHEDGFADFCDGYGGGYTKERILAIMKDSRVGTYGVVGVVMVLGIRFYSLINIPSNLLILSLIAANAFSRLVPVFLIATAQYVRDDETSKSRSVASHVDPVSFLIAFVCGVFPLVFIPWRSILIIVLLSAVCLMLFRYYVIRKTGGYTGDALGALQQIIEVCFYLAIIMTTSVTL